MNHLHPLPSLLTACAALACQTAAQAGEPFTVPLECRLDSSAWLPCTMTVERLGEHWWLQVGRRRFDFRHDGRGRIELQEAQGIRRLVQPSWRSHQALCWDGICAKGDLPLD